MIQRQANAAQRDAVSSERLAAAVLAVPRNGAADLGELQADLMFAAGVELDFDQRT